MLRPGYNSQSICAYDFVLPLTITDYIQNDNVFAHPPLAAGTETAVKPSSARLLAAQLQKKNTDAVGVSTIAMANVGYESITDPRTGQRVHAVDAGAGVGVGVGRDPAAAQASADRDRNVMELELNEKALPTDTVSAPVAGYLYFSLPKDNKKAVHQLGYTLNGQKVSLKLK
jgi:hypothetical protein